MVNQLITLYVIGCVFTIILSILFFEYGEWDRMIAWIILWPILAPYRIIRSALSGFIKEIK